MRTTLLLSCCLLMPFLAAAKPQFDALKKVGSTIAGGITGLFDNCKEQESTFITKPDVRALLFDNSNCRDLIAEVKEGYTSLSLFDKNDVESILVKQGCTLIGYDHNEETKIYKRGRHIGVTAYGSTGAVHKNLKGDEELENKISAVNVTCGVPVNINKCNVPIPQGVGCMLYDDKDCSTEHWDEPVFFGCVEEKSFSILKNPLNFRLKNEAESLTVRAGCTLEVFDDSDFSDDQKTFKADKEDLHVNLKDQWKTKSTNKDIESAKCYCTNPEAPHCKKA